MTRMSSAAIVCDPSVPQPPHPFAARAAATQCALLLTGETGTGKGHLARWIHEHSSRAHKPFIPVNCGAIPESLIDSQLFGHAKGSFSGASQDHLGLVRAADGGTILFDEISELPPTAQLRLLRLLEEREVQPVGHSKPLKVNVRVIAATNADLRTAVDQGSFRRDLYFRLDVVRIDLKPLRNRMADVHSLLHQFNAEFATMYQQSELQFDEGAKDALCSYQWPGNIRELRSLVERLHVLIGARSQEIRDVTVDDVRTFGQLPVLPPALDPDMLGVDRFKSIRVDAVHQALTSCRGNVSRAAHALGVHRSTVYRWLAGQSLTTVPS